MEIDARDLADGSASIVALISPGSDQPGLRIMGRAEAIVERGGTFRRLRY
jgi:hypothetical protein